LYTSCVLRGALRFYFNKAIITYQKKKKKNYGVSCNVPRKLLI
jgi:hypothetical protein